MACELFPKDKDEDVDIPFSQDETPQIVYGANSDFVSKLIAKAQINGEKVGRTPPQSRILGNRMGLRSNRKTKDVESVLKALKLPMHESESPGPVTRSRSQNSGSSACISTQSLDDSTETLFNAVPPTPPIRKAKETPKIERISKFDKIDSSKCSTPLSTISNSKQRHIARNSCGKSTQAHLGLDPSFEEKKSENKPEEDSMDDLLIEATQQAEMKYAQSQSTNLRVNSQKTETPKLGSNRVRKILPQARTSLVIEPDEKTSVGGKEKKPLRKQHIITPAETVAAPTKSKCSIEEIQRKREAALKKRISKLNAK